MMLATVRLMRPLIVFVCEREREREREMEREREREKEREKVYV